MKIATGGIAHETSTFTTIPTTLQNYVERHYLHGKAILEAFDRTNTPIGGFIEAAAEYGFELVPTMFADAQPSAPTPRDLFDRLLDEMLGPMAKAAPLDGVLLELHGAMVVGEPDGDDGIDDPEGHILQAVRDVVGPDVPVAAQLDIHTNMSQRMVEQADVLIGRRSYPEIDMAPRGRQCADVMMRIINDGLRPTMALHRIPMMWGMNQVTAHRPMSEAMAELERIESRASVVCGSIATCFPLADIPHMGASVYMITDNDQALAQSCADELGTWLFNRRADWHYPIPSTHERLKEAEKAGRFPLVLADSRDNTGGGSGGDSTGMLRSFVEAGLEDACVLYIVDPESVSLCHAAGVGAKLDLKVGGKSSPFQGKPVDMHPTVVAISDGRFKYDGPMYAGLSGSMGPSAHIQERGIHVLLVTHREQPFDTAFARTLDLDVRKMRYIGVKSAAHFRAGFESWAGAVHLVSEPSLHDPTHLTYRRLGRKLYPLDEI